MTDYKKEFQNSFKTLCYTYNRWSVWQDFIDMSALSIANSVDIRSGIKEKREKEYLSIAKKYKKSELEQFANLLAIVVMALDDGFRDFLGDIFMDMNFGGEHGQFFTPWNVAKMMSEILVTDDMLAEAIKHTGYISVNDCACGAGVMLLAFAESCKNKGINYQEKVMFVAQDIDPTVAKMCYIQMSLLGCPGYVYIGNSITEPITGSVLEPVVRDSSHLWFTPFYYFRYVNFSILERKPNYENKYSMPDKKLQKEFVKEAQLNKTDKRVQRQRITPEEAKKRNEKLARKLKRFFGTAEK